MLRFRTDAQGRYTVGYLLPATYVVHVDAPRGARLIGADVPNVTISARQQTTVVTATIVGETGPVPNPQIEWSTSNPAVLSLISDPLPGASSRYAPRPACTRSIEPLKAGTATITATSEGKSGTAVVTVRARP
jgi:uncharacterized protein YjdB